MRQGQRNDHRFHSFLALLLGLALVTLSGVAAGHARGGVSPGDHWMAIDAGFLRRFPAPVRAAIEAHMKQCGAYAVQQSFARYIRAGSSHQEYIAIHFHRLRCADKSRICGPDGCLHQVYAPAGGTYRLIFNARVGDVELAAVNGRAAVRVECESGGGPHCPSLLLWNGSRLGERP
jgi:hypothetical protein